MDYWHKNWTCPFFMWDDRLSIGCEGGKIRFPDKDTAVGYMNRFCSCADAGWKKCTVAASLMVYYEQ